MIHRSGVVDGTRVYETPIKRLPPEATDLEYQISSHQVWLPGVYDSERAARYAFRFKDEELQALMDDAAYGERHVITYEMLRRLRSTAASTAPSSGRGE